MEPNHRLSSTTDTPKIDIPPPTHKNSWFQIQQAASKSFASISTFFSSLAKGLERLANRVVLVSSWVTKARPIDDIVNGKPTNEIFQRPPGSMGFTAERIDPPITFINQEGEVIKIDAVKITNPEAPPNSWCVYSGGNASLMEQEIRSPDIGDLAEGLKANMILFNYPGVMGSEGKNPLTADLVNSYKAVLKYAETLANTEKTEEQEGSFGKVFGFGYSIGGLIQAEALNGYKLNSKIGYCFVKDRTGSSMWNALHGLGKIAWIMGNTLNAVPSTEKAEVPQVIIQRYQETLGSRTGITRLLERMKQQEAAIKTSKKTYKVANDGIFSAKGALASVFARKIEMEKPLVRETLSPYTLKNRAIHIIATKEDHFTALPLRAIGSFAAQIATRPTPSQS
jgi:hypothetical protein